jgi:hypothetical protein
MAAGHVDTVVPFGSVNEWFALQNQNWKVSADINKMIYSTYQKQRPIHQHPNEERTEEKEKRGLTTYIVTYVCTLLTVP